MSLALPKAGQEPLDGVGGVFTRPWYQFFRKIRDRLNVVRSEFSSYWSSSEAVSSGSYKKVTPNAEHFDKGGVYSTSNGKFTAPTDGLFVFGASVNLDRASDQDLMSLALYVNGTAARKSARSTTSAFISTVLGTNLMTILDLQKNDEVELYVKHSHGSDLDVVDGSDESSFFGYILDARQVG